MTTPHLPILTLPELVHVAPQSLTASARYRSSRRLLRQGPFADRPDVWSLDWSAIEDDAATLWPTPPGERCQDLAQSLASQLTGLGRPPRMVLVGDHANPAEVATVVRTLAQRGIAIRLTTSRLIPMTLADVLEQYRELVRVIVGLPTINRAIAMALEPDAPRPEDRLETIADLIDRNIPVEAALDPLLPTVTDVPTQVRATLESLADAGVENIVAGYLVLRTGTRERLDEPLATLGCADTVFSSYLDGPMLRDQGRISQFLSKPRRQRGYATVMGIAAGFGMTTRLDPLANPDFRPPRRPEPGHQPRSLRAEFRGEVQPIRSADAASA